MLEVGLEPTCLATHEPESCVSANFTTRAILKIQPSTKIF